MKMDDEGGGTYGGLLGVLDLVCYLHSFQILGTEVNDRS
jgi:hypothetical protein